MPSFTSGLTNFSQLAGQLALGQVPDGMFTANDTARLKFGSEFVETRLLQDNRITAAKLAFPVPELVLSDMISGSNEQGHRITGLDLNSDDMYLVRWFINNAHAGQVNYSLTFNDELTATDYEVQRLLANGGAITSARGNNGVIGVIEEDETAAVELRILKHGPQVNTFARFFENDGAVMTLRESIHQRLSGVNVAVIELRGDQPDAFLVGSNVAIWKFPLT